MSTAAAIAQASARSAHRAGLVWGALGVLIFSVSLPATRLAVMGGLDPAFVGMGRGVVAGVLAGATLLVSRTRWPDWPTTLRLGMVAGGVVIGFPFLTALALARVPSVHGIVVVGVLPAATAVAAIVRGGERASWGFWLAAMAGLGCVLGFAALRGNGQFDAADLCLLAAVVVCAVGYAEGGVLARDLGGINVICFALVLGLPATILITAVQSNFGGLLRATPEAWLGFGYVAIFSAFIGFFAWYRGLALGGIARIGQVQLAQPLLSLAWAMLLLGEPVDAPTVALACGVILCVVGTQRAR